MLKVNICLYFIIIHILSLVFSGWYRELHLIDVALTYICSWEKNKFMGNILIKMMNKFFLIIECFHLTSLLFVIAQRYIMLYEVVYWSYVVRCSFLNHLDLG